MNDVSKVFAVLLGSSPNALAAAARLGRAGREVVVLETREVLGGPTATETFTPGFRAESGVMSAAIDPEIARDLGLSIDVIRRESVTGLGDRPVTLREMPRLPSAVAHAVELLGAINAIDPPEMPAPAAADREALIALGARLKGYGPREMHEVLRLLFMPVRDFLRESVEAEAVRGILGGAAVRGVSEGPFAPGTMLNLLHQLAIGEGLFRSTVRGGLGKLSEAIAEKARAAGVAIRTGVPGPLAIEVEDGAARGVRLGDGQRIEAEVVVSDFDARYTLTKLVAPQEISPEDNRAIRRLRYRGTVARINLALSGMPAFRGVDAEALRGTLVVAPDVASLERAWDQGKRGVMSSDPYLEVTLPALADPSLAPEGKQVMSIWVQHVPHGRGDRVAICAAVVARLSAFAPGLSGLVEHAQVLLPEDLEARFSLTEGHLQGGEVSFAQAFFLRPIPGFARYSSPIENLYLGGSAAHPPGYSGRSGWNLARVLLERR